jgi:phosphatidylglycerophosphate synthase
MDSPRYSALVNVPEVSKYNILGLTQLERTLIALGKAGVEACFITAKNVEEVTAALGKIKAVPVRVFPVENMQDAHQLATEAGFTGVFVAPKPLVVDLSILEDLKKQLGTNGAVMPDAGGIALATPAVAKQFRAQLLTQGKLAEGLQNPALLETGNRTCQTVDTKEELRQVKKRMIKNLTKPTDGIISRNINRKVSTSISRWVVYLPVTPNQLTLVTGLIAFIPCYFMYQGGYKNWLIGAATYQLASILDGVDGEIARLKMKSSKFGQWLDTMLDFVSMIAVLLCLVAGVHRVDQPEYIRWAGKLAIIFAVLCFLGLLLYVYRFKKEGSFNIQYSFLDSDSKWAKVIKSLDFLGKRDFYIFFFLILAVFGLMPWALVYVGAITVLVFTFIVQAHFQTKA